MRRMRAWQLKQEANVAQQQTTKNVFDLSGGLNTELHDLAWPDGFTAGEANYELLSDGTRRRRRGLASEASNTAQAVATITGTQFNQSYKWKNVGGDPDKSFIVHQIGSKLLFTNDDETPSASWHAESIDAQAFSAQTVPVAAKVTDNALRFGQGRGNLFVSGPYIFPFYVSYDATLDGFTARLIRVQYRDFEGIDDGVTTAETPTDASIPADHRYNLRNRGWKDADLTLLRASGNAKFPAKNGLWYKAYGRKSDTTAGAGAVHPDDGLMALETAKYDGEAFGNSSAPQGAVFLNPFDTTFAGTVSGGDAPIDITTWTVFDESVSTWVITITVTAHGLADDDFVTISGNEFTYSSTNPSPPFDTIFYTASWDGTHQIDNKTANTFEIEVPRPFNWQAWSSQYLALGSIGTAGQTALAKSDGSIVQRGFEAIGFYAGRVWYAGMVDGQFADHVFFSRICETPKAYGQCHQRQDPTDENFNALTPADGGVLVVPGLSGVKDMMVIGNSLVLVGTQGAWEVSGNRGSVFTATAFNVRQLTTANFNSPTGAIAIDDSGIATGPSGIYQFAPNEFTRLLEAKNMIRDTIMTKWNEYTTAEQQRVQVAYDDAKQRVYLMIGATAADNDYDEMLIFDVRQGSWFVYTFSITGDEKLLTMVAITDADDSSNNQKMKFLYSPSSTTLDVADFEQTDYLDFDGLESPLPFMTTGFDNLGDFQRRKQAPVITVFQKRTETGYNADLDEAINPSSTLMTAFWDWTEATEYDIKSPGTPTKQQAWTATSGNFGVSGKIGAQAEVYRHTRSFVPLATTDVDGYPTVVTRNKVRGRGRVLQLRFDGATGKDSHLIGWSTNYKVAVRSV